MRGSFHENGEKQVQLLDKWLRMVIQQRRTKQNREPQNVKTRTLSKKSRSKHNKMTLDLCKAFLLVSFFKAQTNVILFSFRNGKPSATSQGTPRDLPKGFLEGWSQLLQGGRRGWFCVAQKAKKKRPYKSPAKSCYCFTANALQWCLFACLRELQWNRTILDPVQPLEQQLPIFRWSKAASSQPTRDPKKFFP